MYKDLCSKYPIISIEDPFNEDDWESYAKFTELGLVQASRGCLVMPVVTGGL